MGLILRYYHIAVKIVMLIRIHLFFLLYEARLSQFLTVLFYGTVPECKKYILLNQHIMLYNLQCIVSVPTLRVGYGMNFTAATWFHQLTAYLPIPLLTV